MHESLEKKTEVVEIDRSETREILPRKWWSGSVGVSGVDNLVVAKEQMIHALQQTSESMGDFSFSGYMYTTEKERRNQASIKQITYHFSRNPRFASPGAGFHRKVLKQLSRDVEKMVEHDQAYSVGMGEEELSIRPRLRVVMGLDEGYARHRVKNLLSRITPDEQGRIAITDLESVKQEIVAQVSNIKDYGIELSNIHSLSELRQALIEGNFSKRHSFEEVSVLLDVSGIELQRAEVVSVYRDKQTQEWRSYEEPVAVVEFDPENTETVRAIAEKLHQQRIYVEDLEKGRVRSIEFKKYCDWPDPSEEDVAGKLYNEVIATFENIKGQLSSHEALRFQQAISEAGTIIKIDPVKTGEGLWELNWRLRQRTKPEFSLAKTEEESVDYKKWGYEEIMRLRDVDPPAIPDNETLYRQLSSEGEPLLYDWLGFRMRAVKIEHKAISGGAYAASEDGMRPAGDSTRVGRVSWSIKHQAQLPDGSWIDLFSPGFAEELYARDKNSAPQDAVVPGETRGQALRRLLDSWAPESDWFPIIPIVEGWEKGPGRFDGAFNGRPYLFREEAMLLPGVKIPAEEGYEYEGDDEGTKQYRTHELFVASGDGSDARKIGELVFDYGKQKGEERWYPRVIRFPINKEDFFDDARRLALEWRPAEGI